MTSPNPSADGARRPRPAVIVRPDEPAAGVPPTRYGSAGFFSTMMHLALLGLFVLIAPRGTANPIIEYPDLSAPLVESVEDEKKPPIIATEVDELSIGVDPIHAYDLNRRDVVAVPGADDLAATVGRPDGTSEGPPVSVPEPSGQFRPGKPGTMFDGGDALPGRGLFGGPGLPRDHRPSAKLGDGGASPEKFFEDGLTPASEAAVARGLMWLARVQSPGGLWKLDGPFPDKGNANDVAGTALGLLPFLAAGKTHKESKNNPYDKPIERALRALIALQDKRTGAFSRDMYAHGLATIAICEAFGISQDYSLKRPAQQALNFIVSAQHAGGGWRYSPGQAGDMSVSGWQIMALKSGLMAGLDVPAVTLRKAQLFLDNVTDAKTDGASYLENQAATPTMTAATLLCRQYLQNWGRQNLRLIKGVDNHIKPHSPRSAKKDTYYFYYATQVMHNLGGDDWRLWNKEMRDRLIATQADDKSDPSTWGSWSPAGDQWGGSGGRLMVTSLNLLTLEVYYRYLPLFYREQGANAVKGL